MKSGLRRRDALGMLAVGGAAIWAAVSSQRRYDVPEVSVERARDLLDSGALVLDVRSANAFGSRHLPAAILMPLAVLRSGIPQSLVADKARQILVYCNDGAVTGPEATHRLVQAGFTRVVNLQSGIEGWAAAGLPVVQG